MKSIKKITSLICTLSIVLGISAPAVFKTSAAQNVEMEVTANDGSQWLADYDTEYNSFAFSEENGMYNIVTKKGAENTDRSAFKILSRNLYPVSTGYQLRCREAAGADTFFGLTSEYSLNTKSDNAIVFKRKNGSPTENQAEISVNIRNHDFTLVQTSASYTRNRVSKIEVVKKNGSFYLSWNGIVLDGEGMNKYVTDYCKLENHFPKEALENDLPLHFYAACNKLLTNESFSFKPDRNLEDGILNFSANEYADPNNPDSLTVVKPAKHKFDAEKGKYTVSLETNKTMAAVMAPVTTINPETGMSGQFNIECYIDNFDPRKQPWLGFQFSNDPTFTDPNRIYFIAVRTTNAGVHMGWFEDNRPDGWALLTNSNNNFFDSPNRDKRTWQFKKDPKDGKIKLHIWGSELCDENDARVVTHDFTSLAGKPVYLRLFAHDTCGFTLRTDITTDKGSALKENIAEAEKLAMSKPTELADIEKVIAEFDANAYRNTVSKEAAMNLLNVRLNLYVERENALQAKMAQLRKDINALPTASRLNSSNFTAEIKEKICAAYSTYMSLGERKSEIEKRYSYKLDSLIKKLPSLDEDFANKKAAADKFDADIKAIGAPETIVVENYESVLAAINELETRYSNMDEFQKVLIKPQALKNLEVLKARLPVVKEAYDCFNAINALPGTENLTLKDEVALLDAIKSYISLKEPALIKAEQIQKLDDLKKAMDEIKIRELEWYSEYPEIKYTGENKNGYEFTETVNKIKGDVFATTTQKYDMTEKSLYWGAPYCGGGQFMLLGLANGVKNQELATEAENCISFIVRPIEGGVRLSYFDSTNPSEKEEIGFVPGFDLDGVHTFAFTKAEDGHWYLVVDGKVQNEHFYATFDTYMEKYGKSTHVSIGGRNGFRANIVSVVNPKELAGGGDWIFSVPFGSSAVKENGIIHVKAKKGVQATYAVKIDELDKKKITVNSKKQGVIGCWFAIGFLKNPVTDGNYRTVKDNGVIVRLVNRPNKNDHRTHILVQREGDAGWLTIDAKEPNIMDGENFELSLVRQRDRHYYLKITWTNNGYNGSYILKLDKDPEHPEDKRYQAFWMDDLVKNGAYLTMSMSSHELDVDLSVSNRVDEPETEAASEAAVNFILKFEDNYKLLANGDEKAYREMNSAWEALEFSDKIAVAGDYLDDDVSFNILNDIKKYNEHSFDEYIESEEEREVTAEELEELKKELEEDYYADYEIIDKETGEIIYTVKNLSSADRVDVMEISGVSDGNKALTVLISAIAVAGIIIAPSLKRKLAARKG